MGSKDLTTLFHKINKIITLNPEDRSEYMKHCEIIREVVKNELLKNSDLIKKMSNGIEFSGSYRDNLKVSKPDEYDLNIILKLPLSSDMVMVRKEKPGYLTINISQLLEEMETATEMAKVHKELAKLTDSSGFLLQNKLIAWFEGIFAKSFEAIRSAVGSQYILKQRKQGPALTVIVATSSTNISFSIDFVPGIKFGLNKWIAARDIPRCPKKEEQHWMAIPKPNKNLPGDNALWIASYPAQDHNIIRDKNRLKDSIRFIKKIRDTQDIHNLKSFYIKNIIMLETDKRNTSYWDSPLPDVLKDMLDAVIACLKNGNIPSYWDEDLNLIEVLRKDQTQDMVYKLESVRRIWYTSLEEKNIMATILTKSEINGMDTPSSLGDFFGRLTAELDLLDSDSDEYYEPRPRVVAPRPEQTDTSNFPTPALIAVGVGLLTYWALKPNRND